MELQLIMDGGAETLNGAMWFGNTSSPSYEQLSPVRSNRCDVVADPEQVRDVIVTVVMRDSALWTLIVHGRNK